MVKIITEIPEELNEKLVQRSQSMGIPKSSVLKTALYEMLQEGDK